MEQGHFDSLQWVKLDEPITAPGDSARAIEEAGIPQAPPPDNQSPVKEARYLLRALAEVEHALLAQYLYAAYTATSPQTTRKLVEIAKEEMGHLLCVQNLLGAV